VHRLVRQGLVLTEPVGNAIICRFNNEHLAARSIRELITLRSSLLALLRAEISGWAIVSVHASLFGSAARGDGDTESDLDLLVVRRDDLTAQEKSSWDDQLAATGQRARIATGNPANWFDITRSDLSQAVEAAEPIVAQWRRDSIPLAGESLTALIGLGA